MSDDEQFARFVRETGTQLHRAALLLTGDVHRAEDLTQAAYAKVFASWRRVSRADNPLAYTRTLLLNTFLSQRRLRRSGEVPTDQPLDAAVAAPPYDPTTRLDLLTALATLPALDRAVVVLRYWEDRSVADTARDLGLTESVVRARSRRALQRLRPLLTDRLERKSP